MTFSVLIKNTQLISQDGVPLWKFDGRISEEIRHSNNITSHPVEKGSENEHIQAKNVEVDMTGVVSNSHFGSGLEFFDNSGNRLVTQYEALSYLADNGIRFDLFTRLKFFENVAIANVAFLQDKPSDAMSISISFTRLTVANTIQVLIPSDILARKNRRGKQALSDADWCSELEVKNAIKKGLDPRTVGPFLSNSPVPDVGPVQRTVGPEKFNLKCAGKKLKGSKDKNLGIIKGAIQFINSDTTKAQSFKDSLDGYNSFINNSTVSVAGG